MLFRNKINLVEISKNQKLFLQNAKHKQEKKLTIEFGKTKKNK